MRILVFGAGAIGSLLGGLLSRVHTVTLVGRDPHMRMVAGSGLRIEGPQPFTVWPKARTRADPHDAPELVLLTVKAFDTERALRDLAPAMGPATVLVSAQNGLGNWELARQAFPKHKALAATVTYGAALAAARRVAWNGTGTIVVGGGPGDREAAAGVVTALRAADLLAESTSNVAGALWLKAIVNAAINPLTTIHRCVNGRLLEDPALRHRMHRAADEAALVARAEKAVLAVRDPVVHVEGIARATAANRSSMLQSVERGQRTEIDAITGHILAAARRHRIPCPENEALYAAVKALEPPPAA